MNDFQKPGKPTGENIDNSQWVAEADFFDREAESYDVTPLKPEIRERYANGKGAWAIDFQFRIAGDLRGKRVLDVGAGTGENSLVLAALGAKATSIDISPRITGGSSETLGIEWAVWFD
jgi:2-polyprenyl-3-methyl-5-hydroxy-6-metoxy-1,4-benzoquinol methylase